MTTPPHGLAYVGGVTSVIGASAVPHTFTYASTQGNTVIITGTWVTASAELIFTANSVSDSGSNSWSFASPATQKNPITGNYEQQFTAWCVGANAASSFSLDIPASIESSTVSLSEWDGFTLIRDLGGHGFPCFYVTPPASLL